MNRTITVKGIGTASAAPDYVVLHLTLETAGKTYPAAVEESGRRIDLLHSAVEQLGMDKAELKTAAFGVDANYVSRKDCHGDYERVFDGYVCRQELKLSFDFDSRRLARVLSAIADSGAGPELDIRFTVKEPEGVKQELLESAARNARARAEVLCAASGVALGRLVSIDYNWGEVNIYSDTRYELEDECRSMLADCAVPEITPEDIRARDTATFVWELQ